MLSLGSTYLGDGIGEKYLPAEYQNLQVDSFFISVNKNDLGMWVSLYSYRNHCLLDQLSNSDFFYSMQMSSRMVLP
jgi:hypothetical protein